MAQPFLQSNVPGVPCKRGKVRDVYDLGDKLVIVASDRISAFDFVLPTGIPDKGKVLTGLLKRIDGGLTGIAVEDVAGLDRAVAALGT